MLDASVGARVTSDIALGLQLRASTAEGGHYSTGGACPTDTYVDLAAYDVGLGAQFLGRIATAQLWVGARFARGTTRTRTHAFVTYPDPPPPDEIEKLRPSPSLSGGFLIAVDVSWQDPYRASLYFSLQLSKLDYEARLPYPEAFAGTYGSLTLGVAHRR